MSQEVLVLLSPFVMAMLAISVWGWTRVPDDTRFRGRLGPTGLDFTVGKRTGFGMRLFTGIFTWLGAGVAGANGLGSGPAVGLGAAALIVLLIGQIYAVRKVSN